MIEGLLVDERIKQSREKKSKPEVEIATTMLLKLNQTHTLPGAVQDFLKEYIQACLEKNIQELRNNLKNYKEFKQKYDSEKFLQQKLPGLEIPELSTEWIQELARAIIQMATLDTKHIDSIKTNWQEVFAQAKDLHDRWVAGINPEKALEINSPVYDLATKDDYSPLRSQLFLGNSY